MFVTLNVIVPAGIDEVFESLNASSEGLPAVAVMTWASDDDSTLLRGRRSSSADPRAEQGHRRERQADAERG